MQAKKQIIICEIPRRAHDEMIIYDKKNLGYLADIFRGKKDNDINLTAVTALARA